MRVRTKKEIDYIEVAGMHGDGVDGLRALGGC